jgi:hypothetical protein
MGVHGKTVEDEQIGTDDEKIEEEEMGAGSERWVARKTLGCFAGTTGKFSWNTLILPQ